MARQQIEKAKAEQRAATRKENKEKKGGETGGRDGLRGVVTSGSGTAVVKKEEGGKRKRKSEPGPGAASKKIKLEEGEVSRLSWTGNLADMN